MLLNDQIYPQQPGQQQKRYSDIGDNELRIIGCIGGAVQIQHWIPRQSEQQGNRYPGRNKTELKFLELTEIGFVLFVYI